MQEEKPLVSICIPTYNRSDSLQKCIESIVCQPEFQNKEVEIAISDNASTDDTEAVGRSYADRFENISYHRQSVGTPIADMNFPLALSYGTGTLRKLSNDSIVYYPDSMRFFCKAARENIDQRPVLFFANENTENVATASLDAEAFVRSLGYKMTWIGSYSTWSQDCNEIAKDTEYCHTHLWQVERTLRFLSRAGGKIYSRLFCRATGWKRKKDLTFGLFQTFYTNYFKIMQHYYEQGIVSTECMGFLKKDNLNVLAIMMMRQDTKFPQIIFDENEHIRELVFQAYQNESYFPAFRTAYLKLMDDCKHTDRRMHTFCSTHQKFYLYGTGGIAKRMLLRLRECGIEPAGCLVSPGHKAVDRWNGLPVYALDEIVLKKDDGILVTVSEALQSEIRRLLVQYRLADRAYFCEFPKLGKWM